MPLNTEVDYNNVVIKGIVELGVKGERGLQGFKGDQGIQGPPVPLAHELGDDPDLAVSQKLLTDSIADMEQSNSNAVMEATHQAGLAGDSAVIATDQAGIAASRADEAAQSAQAASGSALAAGQYANTATEQAGIATIKAGEASSSAVDAAIHAGLAADSETAAEQAATIATNKADEASQSAQAAAQSATQAEETLDDKVDRVEGYSLVADDMIDKLSTIEEYATANIPDNKNSFRGFDSSQTAGSLTGITVIHDETGFTVSGGSFILANSTIQQPISDQLIVEFNVEEATHNTGTTRSLIRIYLKNGTTITSIVPVIPNGTNGWYRMVTRDLSTVNTDELDYVLIRLDATDDAVLKLSNIFIGQHDPQKGFFGFDDEEKKLIRNTQYINLVPRFDRVLTKSSNVTESNGSITIPAGSIYTFSVSSNEDLFFSFIQEQVEYGNAKLEVIRYNGSSAAVQINSYFTGDGVECNSTVNMTGYDRAQFTFRASSNPIVIKNIIVSTDRVLQTERKFVQIPTQLSDVEYDVATNFYPDPLFKRALNTRANTQTVFRDGYIELQGDDTYTFEVDRSKLAGVNDGDTIWFCIEGDVQHNPDIPTLTMFGRNAVGQTVGGVSRTFGQADTRHNFAWVVPAGTTVVAGVVRANSSATVKIRYIYIGDKELLVGRQVNDVLKKQTEYGTQVNYWPYRKLVGFSKAGNDIEYPITEDEYGQPILELPSVSNSGHYLGQSCQWSINYSSWMRQSNPEFSIELASSVSRSTVLRFEYFDLAGTLLTGNNQEIVLHTDGSFAFINTRLPKDINGTEIGRVIISVYQADNTASVFIKRPIIAKSEINSSVRYFDYVGSDTAAALPRFDRLSDALASAPDGIFSVGTYLFKPEQENVSSIDQYTQVASSDKQPRGDMFNLGYVDSGAYKVVCLDTDETIYLAKSGTNNLYKLTLDDFYSRFVAGADVGGEKRYTFDDASLTPTSTTWNASFGRVTGNGNLVGVTESAAIYSTDNNNTFQAAAGYSSLEGNLLDGWAVDCHDNIVIASGYAPAPNRAQGRLNYSNDHGATWKTIFDVATDDALLGTSQASTHIHGCFYDPYWKRIWMVLGDYSVATSSMVGKILWCDNPDDATPTWNVEPTDPTRTNEQHLTGIAMKDCLLFSSDFNPSGIYRRARVAKDQSTLTDQAVFLHSGLGYFPGGWNRYSADLPASLPCWSFDKARYDNSNPDRLYATMDGVKFHLIWEETAQYSDIQGRAYSFAWILPKERVLIKKLADDRFVGSVETWVTGRLKSWQ